MPILISSLNSRHLDLSVIIRHFYNFGGRRRCGGGLGCSAAVSARWLRPLGGAHATAAAVAKIEKLGGWSISMDVRFDHVLASVSTSFWRLFRLRFDIHYEFDLMLVTNSI